MNSPVSANILLAVFFAGTICLGASCCKKDEPPAPTLPPETQTGENTFGCLVDGNIWLPKGNGISIPTFQKDYYYGGILIGANKTSTDERINLNVTGIFSDTLFIIGMKA